MIAIGRSVFCSCSLCFPTFETLYMHGVARMGVLRYLVIMGVGQFRLNLSSLFFVKQEIDTKFESGLRVPLVSSEKVIACVSRQEVGIRFTKQGPTLLSRKHVETVVDGMDGEALKAVQEKESLFQSQLNRLLGGSWIDVLLQGDACRG